MKKFKQRLSIITVFSMLTYLLSPVASASSPLDDINNIYEEAQQIANAFDEEPEGVEEIEVNTDSMPDFTEPLTPSDDLTNHDTNIQQADKEEDLYNPDSTIQQIKMEVDLNSLAENVLQAESEEKLIEFISGAQAGELCEIEVINDIFLTSSVVIEDQQNIKIYSDTATLTVGDGRHFEVKGILTFDSITLDGENTSGGVLVSGGSLILNTGATITNCYTTASGGGIYAENGHIEIDGGTIMGNESGQHGGGIFATDNSSIVLHNGSIRENTLFGTGNSGAGIAIYDEDSSLTMYGGEIAENKTDLTSNFSAGGGVDLMGTFNMYHGTISDNESTAYGGGVNIGKSGIMNMQGGTISHNTVHKIQSPNALTPCGGGIFVGGGGFLTVDDGTIEYNTSSYGGGVFVGYPTGEDTIFQFNGGTIRANNAADYGGGIMAQYNNTIVNIDGGTVGGETPEDANLAANGGGLFIMQGKVNLDSGTILGNQAATTGGGVYNYGGQFNMDGGGVNGNTAPQAGGIMIFGINASNMAIFSMSKGEISDNRATVKEGGGILFYADADAQITGGKIQGNNAKTGGGGIHLNSGMTLPITNAHITDNSSEGSGGGIFVTGSMINMDSGSVQNNKANGSGGGIYATTNSTFNIDGGNISGNQSSKYGGGIYLTNDSNAAMTGGTIGGKTESLGNQTGDYGSGVYVNAGSSFVLDGGFIEGNRKTLNPSGGGGGGGVYVVDGSSFEVQSGAIKNNTAFGNENSPSYGGGIMLGTTAYGITPPEPSSLTMTGGSIEGNTSDVYGGGVAILGNSTFSMAGGFISGNTAVDRYGGGVYMGNAHSDSTVHFTMTGGSITDNAAVAGGGVMMAPTDMSTIVQFDMEGGLISDNKTTVYYGGGICAFYGSSVFNMGQNWNDSLSIPTIKENNAKTHGGGIYSFSSEVHVYKGIVKENNAQISGGGIMLENLAKLQMENAEVIGNFAVKSGGGIYVNENAELMILSSTSLTDNISEHQGGAIYSAKFSTYEKNMDVHSDYANLNISNDTVFSGNQADGLYYPPENADSFENIGFAQNSLPNLVGHPLNNFDINYVQEPAVTLYTITYHANDETSAPKTVKYIVAPDGSHAIKGDSDAEIGFTRENYIFIGWNSLENGLGTDYAKGMTLEHINEDIILYAQWRYLGSNLTYTITYDANGGKGSHQDSDLLQGTAYRVKTQSETGIIRSGYTFVNWNTQQNGKGTAYSPQDTFLIEESLTLFAQWQKDSGGSGGGGSGSSATYSVTYDANGGEGSHKDSGLSLGITYTVKTQSETGITHNEYIFINWNTKKDGSGIQYDPHDTFTINGNANLYAQWKKIIKPLNTEDHMAYIVGYPDNTVKPNANITRAETATIFFRLLTEEFRNEHLSRSNPFSDVTGSDWFNIAVSTLSYANIVSGYEDGTFDGNQFITRAEFAVIAVRFDDGSYVGTDKFTDIETHWAKEYINQAADKGWISGYPDGTFQPDQYITRAEAISLINRVLERNKINEIHPDMITWPDNPADQWYYLAIQEATNSHEYERDNKGQEKWIEILPVPNWAVLER